MRYGSPQALKIRGLLALLISRQGWVCSLAIIFGTTPQGLAQPRGAGPLAYAAPNYERRDTAVPFFIRSTDSSAPTEQEAAIDSLNAYWRDIDTKWYEPLTPQSLDAGPTEAMLDSLSQVGDRELVALLNGRRWRISLAPLARFDFNRCEGLRPGFALHGRSMGRREPRVEIGLSYGIADERMRWDVAAKVPLAITASRLGVHAEKRIQLNLDAGDRVISFAGRRGLTSRSIPLRFRPGDALRSSRRRCRVGFATPS